MFKQILSVAFLSVVMIGAAVGLDAPNNDDWGRDLVLDDMFFSGPDNVLTEKEKQAVRIAEAWQHGEIIAHNPVVGQDGSIEFLYGAERPSIVCAVMQITDIELQPAEKVVSINLGDTVRWVVQPAVSAGDTTHIIVRPREIGLDTSMVVTTDRRTYHMRLRSHRTEYMPRVRFSYIEDALAKWDAVKTESAAKRKADTIPETNEYLGDLYFGYTLKGKARWKPVRVYNDSVKTILEMPKAMRQTEAPTLMISRRMGRVFKKRELTIVNYRVQGSRYIVDAVFDEAVMIVGVGGNQERVTITRKPKAGEE
ncbi:MAG: P-type conjugative transfer protein TrbG [Planctomycetota bacterium]|nr:P-type conjugative transfer protein TrbG [Planctomycetota bacterium]